MLKILFQLLKTLPSFQKLLAEWFAEENVATEKALADYRLKTLNDAATIEKLRDDVGLARGAADRLAVESMQIAAQLKMRDTEIERLQNETQNNLKAVAALDSESVFNATIDGAIARY